MRRAKILCTLGPASDDLETIRRLIAAGMDCARLNFSHGTHDEHARVAALVREAAAEAGHTVGLLADLCGPKIRVGEFPDGPVDLHPGQRFTLTSRPVAGDATQAHVSYAAFAGDVQPGAAVLINDGLQRLRVLSVQGEDVLCEVEVGGPLSSRKGVNLPGVALSTPALTDKDRADLGFAVDELGVDFVALSFVRRPEDILQTKALAGDTPVIAKLEKPEAIEHLEAILDAADGAMVARGDLGVEVGPEKVPLIQKRIIREVNARGKIVITATQMLESMIHNAAPTRAEAADVANAVLDGTDALMLSGETAVGHDPAGVVQMMDKIAREIEGAARADDRAWLDDDLANRWGYADAAARAAALMSFALPLKAIVVFTRDGRTAGLLSDHRPQAPIVAVGPSAAVAGQMTLEWGVLSHQHEPPGGLTEAVALADALVKRLDLAVEGESIAVVMGWPAGRPTNTIKLHHVTAG